MITIPNLLKWSYIVKETKDPKGYILENKSETIDIEHGKTHTLEFFNNKKSGLQIIKIDSNRKQPLKHAEFTVYKKSGDVVGEYITDKNGVIIIDNLENGWYKIAETKAPNAYMIDKTPKYVEITYNQFLKIVFENKKLAWFQIKKIDEITGKPLAGAKFTIEKQNSEKIYTNENSTDFVTDAHGFINIPNLAPDYYIVKEIKAPENYILDKTLKTVQVKIDTPTVVTLPINLLPELK